MTTSGAGVAAGRAEPSSTLIDDGYRTGAGLALGSLGLRTALLTAVAAAWGLCGVAFFALPPEGLLVALWSAALVTPHLDSWRAQLVARSCARLLLRMARLRQGSSVDVKAIGELQLLRDTFAGRLVMNALSCSALFGMAAVYVLLTAPALPGRGLLELWWWLPPALIGTSLGWLAWLRVRVRGIESFLDSELQGERQRSTGQASAQSALALTTALRTTQRLPYALALAVWLSWTLAVLVALLASHARFALRPTAVLQLVLPLVLIMFAAGLYQVPYHQATLAPLWPRLTARSPRVLRGTASLSLPLLLGLPVAVLMTLWESLLGLLSGGQPARAWLAGATLVAVAVAGTLFLLRDALRPLRALRRRVGWLSTTATTSSSDAAPEPPAIARELDVEGDEVGHLAAAFIAMQRALGERLLSSAQAQLMLEQQVSARTLELQRRNHELQGALAELERAQTALLHTEHLASIGRLVAGIAHEINNPINAVVNTAAPLREALTSLWASPAQVLSPAQQTEALSELPDMLRVIERGTRRTQQIVQTLHSYANPQPTAGEKADLEVIVAEALDLVQHPQKSCVTIHRPSLPLPPIVGDAGQLQQVFINLLSNALQAVAAPSARRPQVDVELTASHDRVVVAIRDNGPGIPLAVRRRIFDPFFTTKDASSGSGLGLSIAHSITSRHGGSITVSTSEGEGACFSVTLPVGAAPSG